MTNSDMPGRSPDPVDDPQGYQRHLLGLLGEDDPAVVQHATPGAWRTMVDLAGPHLHDAPAEGSGRCSSASPTPSTPRS